MKTYSKVDNNTIKITEETVKQIVSTYSVNDLNKRLANLIAEKDAFIEAQDLKIAEAEKAITEAENLGLVEIIGIPPVPPE